VLCISHTWTAAAHTYVSLRNVSCGLQFGPQVDAIIPRMTA
jgi:hypothetical protein